MMMERWQWNLIPPIPDPVWPDAMQASYLPPHYACLCEAVCGEGSEMGKWSPRRVARSKQCADMAQCLGEHDSDRGNELCDWSDRLCEQACVATTCV